MKTKIMMTALMAGVVMTAGAAQADGHGDRPDFATLDLDGDGAVTLEEMQGQGAARFAAADTDGDGALSVEELVTAQANARAARMLKRLDENGDGLLQESEMQPRGGDRMERMFGHLDKDDDGAISAEEFEAAKDRRGGGRGHGRRGRG